MYDSNSGYSQQGNSNIIYSLFDFPVQEEGKSDLTQAEIKVILYERCYSYEAETKYVEGSAEGNSNYEHSVIDYSIPDLVKSDLTQAEIKARIYEACVLDEPEIIRAEALTRGQEEGSVRLILKRLQTRIIMATIAIWYRVIGGQRDEPHAF